MISAIVSYFRSKARAKRAHIFQNAFTITSDIRILDIGSEDGSNIKNVLQSTTAEPSNVYIADISEEAVNQGHEKYGFVPVEIPEKGMLPFDDGFFDIVYCSSVIEHVTVPKAEVWSLKSGAEFRKRALEQQRAFANEIRRLGKSYFVQTPNKWFPIESHTWLPMVSYLPRRVLVPILSITNRIWVKKTTPDWFLLSSSDMQNVFPDAVLKKEKFVGLTKSIMAIKGNKDS